MAVFVSKVLTYMEQQNKTNAKEILVQREEKRNQNQLCARETERRHSRESFVNKTNRILLFLFDGDREFKAGHLDR